MKSKRGDSPSTAGHPKNSVSIAPRTASGPTSAPLPHRAFCQAVRSLGWTSECVAGRKSVCREIPASPQWQQDYDAAASPVPHLGCVPQDGVRNRPIALGVTRLNGGDADSAGDKTFATGAQFRGLIWHVSASESPIAGRRSIHPATWTRYARNSRAVQSRPDARQSLSLTQSRLCLTTNPFMTPLNNLSVAQLREAVAIKEQIEQLETQLASIFGETTTPEVAGKKRRRMSATSRARMAAAARTRWAKIKGTQATPTKKRRKMSAEGRARISAAAKARWKKAKAAGKNTL
jgi:hypothetical protein